MLAQIIEDPEAAALKRAEAGCFVLISNRPLDGNWNLMQRTMRIHLERTGNMLDGWDGKATDRPTSFMMTTKFIGIMVVAVGPVRALKPPLTAVQLAYLKALDVSENVFVRPRSPT